MDRSLLRELPSVDEVARDSRLKGFVEAHSSAVVMDAARSAIDSMRRAILDGTLTAVSIDSAVERTLGFLDCLTQTSFKRIINASGTILHTNIGRAVLPDEAIEALRFAAEGNANLEFDLTKGERGERDSHVEGLIMKLTGAEAACVVNNNAAGVLIALNTLAEGKEVIISRGELIEIGGSFRLPEIIKKSGCILKEVGTTNRTHGADYTGAVTDATALLLKAHTSNYKVVGFTSDVPLKALVEIGRENGVPVIEDLGSGSLVDLSVWGLPKEPLVSESIAAGADVVTFSGDKLLGGPQAGIIAGKKAFIDRIRKNPLKRALRTGKLTLSSLEAVLRLYLNKEKLRGSVPTLRFITRDLNDIEEAAMKARGLIEAALGGEFKVGVEADSSVIGGGALPDTTLPTRVVSITSESMTAEAISKLFLSGNPAVLGRINKDRFLLDLRTVEDPSLLVPGLK